MEVQRRETAVKHTTDEEEESLGVPVPRVLKSVTMDELREAGMIPEGFPDDPWGASTMPAADGVRSSSSADESGKTKGGDDDSVGPFSYRVKAFHPGVTRSGRPILDPIPPLEELDRRVVGPPRYSLTTAVPDLDALLSLGFGGTIILEVIGGYIVDGEGPDFVIFENPFVVLGGSGEIYVETAIVSVAETDDFDAWRTFPCDPTTAPYSGCAGVVPVHYVEGRPLTSVGGDLFDLSRVGLSRAKYIRIQDSADNEERSLREGTEGFDLDALALIHTRAEH